MTVYAKFIERGTINGSLIGVMHIGDSTNAVDSRLNVFASGGFYVVEHDNGTTVPSVALAAAPSLGDVVELRVALASDGSVQIGQSLNSAAETTSAQSAAAALGTSWGDARLYVGSLGAGASSGVTPFAAVKVAAGTKTMAEMRAL